MPMPTWRKVLGVVLIVAAAISITIAVSNWVRVTEAQHYYALGLKYLNKGDYSKAINYFIKSIGYDPNNWRAWYNLGVAVSEPDEYHRYFKVCGGTFSDSNHPAMQVLYNLTIKAFKEVIKLNPKMAPLAWFGLGNAYFDYYCYYTNRAKYVLPAYLKALQGKDIIYKYLGKEGLAALYTNLARTYLAMAEIQKAREYYVKAIKTYPIDTAYEHLMWVELELGNYTGVLKLMRKYVSMWGFEADLALAPASIAALKLGKYDLVLKYAGKIIKHFPESDYLGEAYRLCAEVYLKEGLKAKAIQYLKKDVQVCTDVLQIGRFPIPGEVPPAWYERGVAYYELAQITGNKTYYRLAAENFLWLIEHPKVANREVAHRNYYLMAHAALACIYAQLGEFSKAKALLKKLINMIETNPDYTGWRKLILKPMQNLYSEIAAGKAPKIPEMLTELEH